MFYKGRTQYLAGANPVLVAIDPNGKPWVSDNPNDGSMLRTLQGDQWIPSSFYRGWASSVVFDQKGNMWIADGSLYKFDGKNRTSFTRQNSGLLRNDPYLVTIDPTDRVWMTYGFSAVEPGLGVTVFDGNTWTTFNISNSGLASNEVTAIAFDSENRAWFGTTHGLSIFDGNKWVTYSLGNSGLLGEAISAIAFDQKGRAWIVSHGNQNGINSFDGKEWVDYSFEEIGFHGSDPKILVDPLGRIWLEGSDVKIFQGDKWIGLAEEDGYNNNVFSIAADPQGKIWIANGNNRGLVVLDSDYAFTSAWQTQPQRIFLSSGGIWYIAFILACLFVAILLDSFATVALALLGGLFTLIGWSVIIQDPHVWYEFLFGNPGVSATVGAMLGAFTGILIATRSGTPKRSRFAVIGFVVGLAIGICQILPAMFAQ
jgi:streptogramin lyase